MNIEELRRWLDKHTDDLCEILDFEPDDEVLDYDGYFKYWLGDDKTFDDAGYEFEAVAQDGTGGKFVLWSSLKFGTSPLVFFGSEGGHGVLTKDFQHLPLILAHGVFISEYGDGDGPTSVQVDDDAQSKQELVRYRAATVAEFGELPPLDSMIGGCDLLNEELRDWIARHLE